MSSLAQLRVLVSPAPRERGEGDDGLSYLGVQGRLVELSSSGASAVMTAATRLIVEAQSRGELCAWLGDVTSAPFAADLEANGVDLASLVVCRLDTAQHRSAIPRAADQLLRSGAFGLVICDLVEVEELRRPGGRASPPNRRPGGLGGQASPPNRRPGGLGGRASPPNRRPGGLGGRASPPNRGPPKNTVPQPLMVRLAGLVRKHQAAAVFLTEKPRELPSLGSLISLRAEARRERGFSRVRDLRVRKRARLSVSLEGLKDKRRAPGWSAEVESRGPAGMG